MTNSKTAKLGFSIFDTIGILLLKLFTFLISTTDKEIYTTFINVFFHSPILQQTNKHTQQSSFNNKIVLLIGNTI